MANDQEGLSVPVIDISVLMAQATSEDVQRAAEAGELTKTIEELRAAATEWGFFYIANHGVSDEDVAALRANSRSFFALPKDIKRTINRHAENSRGYFDFELTKNKTDWKEGFDFGGRHEDENGNGNADRHNAFNEKNQWLEDHHLPGFRASMQAYFDRITQISERLMMLLSLALGKEATYLDQFYRNKNHEKSASSFLRLNYYPVSPDPTSTMGVHHHTDAGGLTVLLQDDDVSSLQVFHRESQQWHLIPPKKDTYVINIGDMLQIWSNDRFVAPLHRVLANGSAERFSAPFFYNPSYDAIVEPVLQEANEEPKYRPLSWFDFRLKRFQGDYADLGEEVQITHYRV